MKVICNKPATLVIFAETEENIEAIRFTATPELFRLTNNCLRC